MLEEPLKQKNLVLLKVFLLKIGRWPEKSVKVMIGLLKNVEANAQVKGLEAEKLNLTHIAVN